MGLNWKSTGFYRKGMKIKVPSISIGLDFSAIVKWIVLLFVGVLFAEFLYCLTFFVFNWNKELYIKEYHVKKVLNDYYTAARSLAEDNRQRIERLEGCVIKEYVHVKPKRKRVYTLMNGKYKGRKIILTR